MTAEKSEFDKGQHFLVDKKIIMKCISSANISKKDNIIEIGAGKGALTENIVKNAGSVLIFEIDKKFYDELIKLEKENKNLKIVFDDALKYSWKNYNKIISNIPFHLAEQVLLRAMKEGIDEIFVFVGEEFKNKLDSDTKVGFFLRLVYDVKLIEKAGKECFVPAPKTDSWLIKFEKKESIGKKEKILLDILNYKGKISNAIINVLVNSGKTKNQAREIVEKSELNREILEKNTGKLTVKLIKRIKNLVFEFV